jgi:protein-tyrosine phosphatase
MSQRDRAWLRTYGLTHVLDLRGQGESPELTCPYARERDVTWRNVSLYGQNLSDPKLLAAQGSLDYLARGYLAMLGNREAVCQALVFLATVPQGECALFHCAAGMDRTGMVSMLLLGAAGVARDDIVRDYLYSFASVREVERFLETGETPETLAGGRLTGRRATICGVYDALVEAHGSIGAYLAFCGLSEGELELLRARLLAC